MKAKQIVCILVLFIFLLFRGTVTLLYTARNTDGTVQNTLASEQVTNEKPDATYPNRIERNVLSSFDINPNVQNFDQLKKYARKFDYIEDYNGCSMTDKKLLTCIRNFEVKETIFFDFFKDNLKTCPQKDDTNIIKFGNDNFTSNNLSRLYCEWFFDLNEIIKSCEKKPHAVLIFRNLFVNFIFRVEYYLENCKKDESNNNYNQEKIKMLENFFNAFKSGNFAKYHCDGPKNYKKRWHLNKKK